MYMWDGLERVGDGMRWDEMGEVNTYILSLLFIIAQIIEVIIVAAVII